MKRNFYRIWIKVEKSLVKRAWPTQCERTGRHFATFVFMTADAVWYDWLKDSFSNDFSPAIEIKWNFTIGYFDFTQNIYFKFELRLNIAWWRHHTGPILAFLSNCICIQV